MIDDYVIEDVEIVDIHFTDDGYLETVYSTGHTTIDKPITNEIWIDDTTTLTGSWRERLNPPLFEQKD